MEATAEALKVELHPVAARYPQEIESAFSVLAQRRVQGLTVFQDGMFLAQGPQIIALAARSRIPTMYGLTDLVRTGGPRERLIDRICYLYYCTRTVG
jgi:hypothetical protein